LSSIILDQRPSIKTANVIAEKRESPLMLHYKLCGVDYVPDIVGTSGSALAAGLISSGSRLLKVFCSVISAFMLHGSILFVCTLEHSYFSWCHTNVPNEVETSHLSKFHFGSWSSSCNTSFVYIPYGILYFDWPSGSVHFLDDMVICGLLVPPEVYIHEELKKDLQNSWSMKDTEKKGWQDFVFQRRKGETYDNPDICRWYCVWRNVEPDGPTFWSSNAIWIWMSLVGELTYYLGLQVKQMKDTIFISQSKEVWHGQH
jgi:hypothetical protein